MTPERIGKYVIESTLGQGGMGVVYKAFDSTLERTVALKVMLASQSVTEEMRARFLREARSAARIQHPNIVQVFDLGEEGGQLFIAMEYIAGSDLQQLMSKGAVGSFDRKIELVMQVCEGLQFAHQHGVVHRDVKPANIRITADNVAKIMDFGIARLGTSELTQTGHIMGTPHYMSPEQIRAKRDIDGRSDQFSVGVILYELISQQRPFDSESLTSVLYHIVTEPHRSLRQILPACDPALADIVDRALAKEAESRFPSCAALAAALGAFRERLPRVTEELRVRVAALERECDTALEHSADRTIAVGPTPAPVTGDPNDYGALLLQHSSLEQRRAGLGSGEPAGTAGALRPEVSPHPTLSASLERRISAYLEDARRAFETRELGRAREALTQALRLDSSNPAALELEHELARAIDHPTVVPGPGTAAVPAAPVPTPAVATTAGRRRAPVAAVAAALVVAALVVGLSLMLRPRGATVPTGQLVLDVAPWARLDAVVSVADGKQLRLDPVVTPAAVTLPAGAYRLVLNNPYYPPALEVEVEVRGDQVVAVRRAMPGFNVEDEVTAALAAPGSE
jgi:serine/threonine protein kinase